MSKSLLFIIMVALVNSAHAAMIPNFVGNSKGYFGASENTIEWGTPASIINKAKSSLAYDEVSGGFSINSDDPFKIGSINYNNTQIRNDDQALSEEIFKIQMTFSTPGIGAIDFLYNLNITNTNNSSSNSADTVSLKHIAGGGAPFITRIDNINYYFNLLGFVDGNNGYINSFTLAEDSVGSFDLYGRISNVNPIPEPPAFWLIAIMVSTIYFGRKYFSRVSAC